MTVSRDTHLTDADLAALVRGTSPSLPRPRRSRRPSRLVGVGWFAALSVMGTTYLTLLRVIEAVGR